MDAPSFRQACLLICDEVWSGGSRAQEDHGWRFKMDPRFFYKYTKEEVASALQKLTCPLLVVHGERSHMVSGTHQLTLRRPWADLPSSTILIIISNLPALITLPCNQSIMFK